jgi:S1-C subfamily serine protease
MRSQLIALPATDPTRSDLQGKVETMDAILKGITKPAPPEVRLLAFYGVEVQPLTAQLLAHFAVSNGVLVASVNANSRAAQGGLQAGDIITKAGGKNISELAALLQALDEPSEPVVLTVQRRRETLTLKIPR